LHQELQLLLQSRMIFPFRHKLLHIAGGGNMVKKRIIFLVFVGMLVCVAAAIALNRPKSDNTSEFKGARFVANERNYCTGVRLNV